MFTVLAIIGGIITTFATGAVLGEVTGAKKAISELPTMLSLPTIEDDDLDDEEDSEVENDEERVNEDE